MLTEGIPAPDFSLEDGTVKKVFPKVSPEGHAQEILAFL